MLSEIVADHGAPVAPGQVRDVAPRELVFRFDAGQQVDPGSLLGIAITRSGDGVFGNGNDVAVDPQRSQQGAFPDGFIGIGERPSEVVVRFSEVLPDDFYRITIFGSGANPLRNTLGQPFNNGLDQVVDFRLALGAQVVAVVPQPITRDALGGLQQARNTIEVYFNNDDLDPVLAQDPSFYHLIFTGNTASNTNDRIYHPTSISYSAALDKATLTFASDLDQLGSGVGTFRLRVGSADAPPQQGLTEVPIAVNTGVDAGSSYATAQNVTPVNPLGTRAIIVSGEIERQNYGLTLPGSSNEPGHRQIAAETSLDTPGASTHLKGVADTTDGVTTIFFDFRRDYGVDPVGNALVNVISDAQKQRAREVLEFYAHYLGVQFVETNPAPGTPSIGFTIATGDLRAVNPQAATGPGDGIAGVAGVPNRPVIGGVPAAVHSIALAVMDSSESTFFGSSEFGGNWFREAMRQIGQIMGYGLATDQPDLTLNGGILPNGSFGNTGEPIFPGDHDIVHGQFLYRPESKDIDLYRFQVTGNGTLRAETFAERLATSSQLDTVLALFADLQSLVVPAAGGGPGGVTDGQTFVLNDGIHPAVTFELDDRNALGVTAGNRAVVFSSTDTAEQIAAAIAKAIQDTPRLDLEAVAQFNRVKLRGVTTVDASSAPSLAVLTSREQIASNDDYYSEDSFMEIRLGPGTYYIGVSSRGNSEYDPTIPDSGFGGTTQGQYQLRMNFTPDASATLADTDGTALDGDVNGIPGGNFNFWFQVGNDANSIYVDKSFTGTQLGTLANPFNNIQAAFNAAVNRPGNEIVRVVGNAGPDGDAATLSDNLAYAVGFNTNGLPLGDGATLDIPRGVTMMVDAGAIFKMRLANIDAGSSAQNIDRSLSHLQVLGTPDQKVIFTSALDESIGNDVTPTASVPAGGNWGGLVFRSDLDLTEAGRTVLEQEGIFLNYVNQADIRYGGGDVVVNSISQRFTPVHMIETRPTVTFNAITRSADASMSADPNSFADTRFQGADFTADYERIGPHIRRNTLAVRQPNGSVAQNSVNGLFVRIRTQAGSPLDVLELGARWDDYDIPHILAENLVVRGTPEGAALAGSSVTVAAGALAEAVTGNPTNDTIATAVNTTLPVVQPGEYRVFRDRGKIGDNPTLIANPNPDRDVDIFRFDLAAGSRVTVNVNVLHDPLGLIPTLDANLRLFNASGTELAFSDAHPSGTEMFFGQTIDPYIEFVATTAGTYYVAVAGAPNRNYNPNAVASGPSVGAFSTGQYDIEITVSATGTEQDARLRIDPGLVVKAAGSRIETTIGAQLIVEGDRERPITFTSLRDDRYGAGGTFDTNADQANTFTSPGDWGGFYVGHLSQGSFDNVLVTFGGGRTRIEGAFDQFNALEIHQADVRVTNSVFEDNAAGLSTTNRNGRGNNAPATIFVRGAQPILVDNIVRGGLGAAISINANAMQAEANSDFGRTTGWGHAFDEHDGGLGPMVVGNRLANNVTNGMEVRPATLTTQTVWDDTDIVHVVRGEIVVPNHHVYGGLRLQSSPTESLVVKLSGPTAGFTATGRPLDIKDRIGGSVQIVGTPSHPVVLTSINDGTVGAGLTPDGQLQVDTNNSGIAAAGTVVSAPMIDQFTDTVPNVDEWFMIADATGTITVQVYDENGGTIDIDGLNPTAVAPQTTATITLTGVVPGSQHTFRHTLAAGLPLTHYRPQFFGVSQVFVQENRTSPNDVFNSSAGGGLQEGSNLELGFDERFDTLPSQFADTTWFYLLDVGDQFNWRGFFDNFPGGADAARIDLLDPSGNIVSSATAAPLLPGAGTTLTTTVAAGQGGFWGVKITAPPTITPFAGHYLMDVEVTSGGLRDPIKSARHYLLENSLLNSVSQGQPGEWRSVQLLEYSNDRNVESIYELEADQTNGRELNGTPATAQVVGQLAPNLKSGDENRRLGFELRGTIAFDSPGDVDTYSFLAQPGTEVWIDLDRTSQALDSVLELVDAAGNVLARSDDSHTEQGSGVFPAIPVGTNLARTLQRDAFGGHDNYTLNPRDAGMRVVLPGPTDVLQTYFVRVYSKNAVETGNPSPAPFTLGAGDTSGHYQLQIRLQEADEVPGSTVQFSDIRFATNGIEAIGLPGNSPLLGDTAELATDTGNEGQGAALNVGNVLQSDAGSISIGGSLATPTDVDWYQFTLNHDLITPETGVRTISMIFDIDYADGIGRPDTVISVFNAQGALIMVGRDSDIADDQVGPTPETGPSDLTRGSFGKRDAYIGPKQLPAGFLPAPGVNVPAQSQTYFVAVSSNGTLPAVLNMTFQGAATNETIKLEPVNSIQRIAEDHIGFSGHTSGVQSAAVDAFGRPLTSSQIDPAASLFDIRTPLSLQANVKPFTLEDVPLFVSSPFDGFNLYTINAATGALETTYRLDFNDFGYVDPVEDIDFRSDGRLFGYATGVTQGNAQNNAGRVFEVDLRDGSPIPFGNDSIPDNVLTSFQVDAMTIVKTRYPAPGNPLPARYENIYYSVQDFQDFFTPQSHLAIGNESANANVPNQGFTVIGPIFETSPGDVGVTTGLATRIEPFTDITGAQFFSENLYGVTDEGHFIFIQPFFFGPGTQGLATVLTTIPGMQFAGLTPGPQNLDFNQDGVFGDLADTFFAITVDGTLVAIEVEAADPTNPLSIPTARQIPVFDVNRDGVLEFTLATEAAFNGPVTGLAFSPVDFNLWHPTERRRNDPGHGVTTPFDNSRDPSVARRVTGSFKKDGQADDVRENFESQGGISFYFGLENSVRDPQLNRTYLQYTYDLEDPVFEAIPRLPGGPTYTDAQYGITDAFSHHDLAVVAGGNNYNLPGGAKGTLVTGEFSLEGYSATDKPTLYFNYFLNTENQSNDPALGRLINEMRDSARVFISADGGFTWSMLATNNAYRDINVPRSELPSFSSASSNIDSTGTRDPRQRIQELFDTTDGSNEWRQARIDLGEFAGLKNLQLRFDFSTAGAMLANRPGDNVPDLPGDEFGNLLNEDRFQNNNFEGWYIDDLMIGFAERGEMVTGSQANTNFFSVPSNPNPAAPQETLTGAYQLEIRAGTEHGSNIAENATPIIVGPSTSFPAGQIFDTNDRMAETFTLIAPGGTGVVDRQTFQINDGDTIVTFEFESGGGVAAGNIPILFNPVDSPAKMAAQIRDAINAAPFDVSATAIATSNKVEIFGAANIIVTEAPRNLTVAIAANSVLESAGGAATTATVTRSGSLVGSLLVTLTSSDTTEATVPATVTIPNGQASVSFNISAVNDTIADGTQTVVISASASGFNQITDSLDVTDNEVAALTVVIASPDTFSENSGLGVTTGTVTRNSPTNVSLLVNLLSSDPSEVRVPATVLIPAGQVSATFNVDAFNDPWIDGTQTANITAHASGFLSGSDTVTILDDGADTIPQTFAPGSPATMGPWLSGPPKAGTQNALGKAFAHLGSQAFAAGFGAANLNNFVVTNQYVSSHTGVTHIYLRQKLNGLEILGTEININLAPDGSVLNMEGRPIASLAFAGLGIEPQMSAEDAVRAAARELVDESLDGTDVTVVQHPTGSNQSMVVMAPEVSRDPIPMKLNYLRVAGGVELVWSMVLRTTDGEHWYDVGVNTETGEVPFVSDWVWNASYEAFHFNLENPDDGPRTILVDPHLAATNASPFGWHDTNGIPGAEFTDTRGNNVFAQEDINGDDAGGFRPTGGPGLNFSYPLDLTQAPAAYTSAAIVNLFFMNNFLHDVHYQYGFTEIAGNFQVNNYGNGGLGNDAVQADAQDGSGFNNANMFTPPDGIAPRMQQFIFTLTTPFRDSDLENTIIVHEYGHGVSTRLTGGPANSNALFAFQSRGMGEGWSDWWSLMFSQKPGDTQFASYPLGNYVLGNLPNGPGIRNFPYNFDMTINPLTYGRISTLNWPHGVGEVWCSALWDMSWLLVNKFGFDSDLYNGNGGNNLALQLVMDGLKLQPANPSMLDARDAILLADQILTGGANQPEIWTAFARRGMGLSAFDGGSGNAINVVEAFDVPVFGTGQTVTVTINSATISENGGASTATVSRSGPTAGDLVVFLATSDDSEAIAVPPVVNIPAGQSSVTIQIVAVDDSVADGTQTVIITPSSPGFDSVTDTIDVLDDEIASLTLVVNNTSILEDGGPQAAFATVTRNTPTDADLVVFLTSHDQSEAVMTSIVPAKTTFGELTSLNDDRGTRTNVGTSTASALAGQVNPDGVIRLAVTGFNDFGFDGTHFQAGGYELFVRVGTGVFPSPFDPNNFTFRRTDSLTPGTLDFFSFPGLTPGVPFIAWINNNIGSGTPDTILGDFAKFPSVTPPILSAVLIPAGQTSATFPIGTPNELLPDGTQTVAITATAPGLASGTDTLDVLEVDNVKRVERTGDINIERPQGQVIIHSNRIVSSSQFGIVIDSSLRDQGSRPHLAAVRNTRELNAQRLVPGVVVENNVIAFNGLGGISFSGDANAGNVPLAAVPFGRIVNNTIFGFATTPTGVGIQIQDNASPTVLNNIVSRMAVGVSISPDSDTTVLGGMLFKLNTTNANTPASIGLGSFAMDLDVLSPTIPLFRNPAGGDFTLIEGSLAIDSSIDSLSDRPELRAVTQPLGISQSSILAPELDQVGRLRIDNPLVASPPGLGFNVFKDRGALERLEPVTVGVADVAAVEGNPGSSAVAVFRVSLSEVLSIPFTVAFSTATGTASATDFIATAGSVTFLPGQTTQLVTVSIVGDVMDEDNETFFLNLGNASAGAAIQDFQGEATIVDDDDAPTITVTDQSVFEGNAGLVTVTLVLSLSAPSGRNVTVDFNTTDGTASGVNDYVPAAGAVTFTPGISTAALTMQTRGDTAVEPNETFFLSLVNPVNATLGTAQATITILDDDATVRISDASVTEGNNGTTTNAVFTVTLDKAPSAPVTMNFFTSNITATAGSDYTSTSGTLSFAPSETLKQITVVVQGDSVDESNETFQVQLLNVVNAFQGDVLGIGTIGDDDNPPEISITSGVSVREGDLGTTNVSFSVTLNAVSGQQVLVAFSTGGGTATAGSDYTAVSGTLTFVQGITQQSIVVPVIGDTAAEANETFLVTLSNPVNATLSTTQFQGTATIEDDEPRVSINDVPLDETNGVAVFNVSLDRTSSAPITVVFATANGTATAGADYQATTGTLSFAPGELFKAVSVQVLHDTLNEANETFFVNLSNVSSGAVLNDGQGLGTIIDNDAPPTISIADSSRTEGNAGPGAMTFRVSLSAASGQEVTVRFATANGTAAAGSDYSNTVGTLTFTPGVTERTITVNVTGDTNVEPDETFFVNLTNPVTNAAIQDGQAVGTIIDDEAQLTIADRSLPEGVANMVFTLTLSKVVGSPVTVNFATANGTAIAGQDYTATSGTVTFTPGQTAAQVTVTVTNDGINEGDESFVVNLSGASGATITDNQATGTIIDDDLPPVLLIEGVTVTEGNVGATNAVLNVRLSEASTRQITVNFATNGGTATPGADFVPTSGVLTFVPGQVSQQITVQVNGDTAPELNETFQVNLGGAVNASIASGTAAVTITDDDPVPLMVTAAGEGGGPHVRVYNALTGQELFGFFAYAFNFTGGVRVATADVNGDGQADIITAPGATGGPHVRVFDGRTGAPVRDFMAFEPTATGGLSVAAADVNLDGRADIIVGTEGGPGARVSVFDGASGGLLNTFNFPANSAFQGGVRVAAGDVNGDGRADVVIANGPGNTPRVTVRDLAQPNAPIIRDFFAYAPSFGGGVYVAAADLNGDGFAEIITGAGSGGGPHVRAFSGTTGQVLREFFAYNINFTGGVRVGTVDGNGDGRLDFLMAPGSPGGPHVRVIDFQSLGSVREFLAYSANFTGGVFVAGSKPGPAGSPQLAAPGQAIASIDAPSISEEELQPILTAAVDRWRAAGVDAEALARLKGIDVHVADLPDGFLGLAFPAAVYIDVNAAGHGWFVDATPGLDEEFVGPLASGTGANRVDLLSTIMHELGHVLGLEDLYGDGDDDEVMYGLLGAGVRRTPSAVDAIFSEEDWK